MLERRGGEAGGKIITGPHSTVTALGPCGNAFADAFSVSTKLLLPQQPVFKDKTKAALKNPSLIPPPAPQQGQLLVREQIQAHVNHSSVLTLAQSQQRTLPRVTNPV